MDCGYKLETAWTESSRSLDRPPSRAMCPRSLFMGKLDTVLWDHPKIQLEMKLRLEKWRGFRILGDFYPAQLSMVLPVVHRTRLLE